MSSAGTSTNRSGSGEALFEDCLDAFITHLRNRGLCDGQICHLRLEARHLLLWLDRHRIPIDEVDHGVLRRFRRHDCHCPGMEKQRRRMLAKDSRRFMTGALRLVRFLEDEGRIEHPGELEANFDHLDTFLDRCAAQGYGPVRLSIYRSSCRHILTRGSIQPLLHGLSATGINPPGQIPNRYRQFMPGCHKLPTNLGTRPAAERSCIGPARQSSPAQLSDAVLRYQAMRDNQ